MHSIKEKMSNFLNNMHLGGQINFQEFSNFSEFSGLILSVPFGFLEAVDID